jgi:hypothetical protein
LVQITSELFSSSENTAAGRISTADGRGGGGHNGVADGVFGGGQNTGNGFVARRIVKYSILFDFDKLWLSFLIPSILKPIVSYISYI